LCPLLGRQEAETTFVIPGLECSGESHVRSMFCGLRDVGQQCS
jgi:hypothetical protein